MLGVENNVQNPVGCSNYIWTRLTRGSWTFLKVHFYHLSCLINISSCSPSSTMIHTFDWHSSPFGPLSPSYSPNLAQKPRSTQANMPCWFPHLAFFWNLHSLASSLQIPGHFEAHLHVFSFQEAFSTHWHLQGLLPSLKTYSSFRPSPPPRTLLANNSGPADVPGVRTPSPLSTTRRVPRKQTLPMPPTRQLSQVNNR